MSSFQPEELVVYAAMLGVAGSAAAVIRSLFPQRHLRLPSRVRPARPLG